MPTKVEGGDAAAVRAGGPFLGRQRPIFEELAYGKTPARSDDRLFQRNTALKARNDEQALADVGVQGDGRGLPPIGRGERHGLAAAGRGRIEGFGVGPPPAVGRWVVGAQGPNAQSVGMPLDDHTAPRRAVETRY